MDFHRHQQSQLFGLYVTMSVEPFDSATVLSKEASDGNLWKLKPTPSRRKLRVFDLHLFVCRQICLDVLAPARTNVHLSMWNLREGLERLSVAMWHVADLL